jgi:hypothetical protein
MSPTPIDFTPLHSVGHLFPAVVPVELPIPVLATVTRVATWTGEVGRDTPLPFYLKGGDWLFVCPDRPDVGYWGLTAINFEIEDPNGQSNRLIAQDRPGTVRVQSPPLGSPAFATPRIGLTANSDVTSLFVYLAVYRGLDQTETGTRENVAYFGGFDAGPDVIAAQANSVTTGARDAQIVRFMWGSAVAELTEPTVVDLTPDDPQRLYGRDGSYRPSDNTIARMYIYESHATSADINTAVFPGTWPGLTNWGGVYYYTWVYATYIGPIGEDPLNRAPIGTGAYPIN